MDIKKLGFGFMRLPLTDPNDRKTIDMEQLKQMVDLFLERGFTYFDTAYIYHDNQSEAALREALVKRHPRESFTVATKLPLFMLKNREQQSAVFEEQLANCGVDYFDYYLLHDINENTYPALATLGSFAFLSELKKAGKVRNIGFSFHAKADLLDELLTSHPEVDFVQLQINYQDWRDVNIQSGKCYETALRHGKSIVVMEPVKGGRLANPPDAAKKLFTDSNPSLSAASWAIRFAAGLDNVLTVLSGMSDLAQMEDNTGYMRGFKPLTAEELEVVRQAAPILRARAGIPCTACRYCEPGCPQNIAIPEYFELHNARLKDGAAPDTPSPVDPARGKPADCVECGQCEEICPQHLPVMEYLKHI